MADDLLQMQRQAARRVQQMQEHSRRVFEAHQGRTAPPAETSALASPGLYGHPADVPPPAVMTASAPASLPLPQLGTDQWLLLGLALLLFRSGCRPEMTLALLYLAL